MKNVLLISIIFVYSCGKLPPSLDEVEANFFENDGAFSELMETTCAMGDKKQPFSYSIDTFRYIPEKIDEEFRNESLDTLLEKVSANAIMYDRKANGDCSLKVGYFSNRFASRGISFLYTFNSENLNLKSRNQQSIDEIIEAKKDTLIDMPLEDDWYITFIYS